jgi:hypothetical protein
MDMAQKKKKRNLSDMPMPSKRGNDLDVSEMEMAEENESPEDEAAESPEYQKREEELGIEKHGDDALAGMSDEDLMAEVKKRGLLNKLEEGEPEGGDGDMDLGMDMAPKGKGRY